MNEIIFLVEDAPEGGFIARALDASIYTEADSLGKSYTKTCGKQRIAILSRKINLKLYACILSAKKSSRHEIIMASLYAWKRHKNQL